MKKLSVSILFVASSFSVLADCDGWVCRDVEISKLYLTSGGHVQVGTSGDESKLDCDVNEANELILDSDHPGFEEIYALLLVSHVQDRKLLIRTAKYGTCDISYVISGG